MRVSGANQRGEDRGRHATAEADAVVAQTAQTGRREGVGKNAVAVFGEDDGTGLTVTAEERHGETGLRYGCG